MNNNKSTESQISKSSINTSVLNYSVYKMTVREKIMYFFLLFIAGGIVGYIFYGNLFQNNGVSTIATHVSNIVVFSLFGMIANKGENVLEKQKDNNYYYNSNYRNWKCIFVKR